MSNFEITVFKFEVHVLTHLNFDDCLVIEGFGS